ncbi:MarR family transcriptional regulator [Pseudonocardia acidicola]|nr:MarR family transcriptional regulator [Pseudonocardia acidicola]
MDTPDMDDTGRGDGDRPTREEIDAIMLAARVFVAIAAQSVAEVNEQVTLPQLRVLVMIASRGPLNLAAVAQSLGVHSSNATRACDRLVTAGLLHRSDDPTDRRNLVLELTRDGRHLVDTMNEKRRTAISGVLEQMSPARRRRLVPLLRAFARAAGEIPDTKAWALGWTTEQPLGGTAPDGSAA